MLNKMTTNDNNSTFNHWSVHSPVRGSKFGDEKQLRWREKRHKDGGLTRLLNVATYVAYRADLITYLRKGLKGNYCLRHFTDLTIVYEGRWDMIQDTLLFSVCIWLKICLYLSSFKSTYWPSLVVISLFQPLTNIITDLIGYELLPLL